MSLPNKDNEKQWQFINMSYAHRVARNDKNFFTEMMKVFKRESMHSFLRMRAYHEQQNFVAIAKVAHSMKPTCVYVGSESMSQLIRTLENQLSVSEPDTNTVRTLLDEIELLLNSIHQEIDAYLVFHE